MRLNRGRSACPVPTPRRRGLLDTGARRTGLAEAMTSLKGALEPLQDAICTPFAVISGLRPVKGQGRASPQGVVTSLRAALACLSK